MRLSITLLIMLTFYNSFAQPNCNAYKYYGDTLKYRACIKAEEINNHYQFSAAFQAILEDALAIDSTYAYAYREQSVAYLKSGDFITWKKLMDKAVKFDTLANLGYRGWCRYQFFRDYQGAIDDIELFDDYMKNDIGYSANGHYHLNIAKAFCYKAIGEKAKAISIIENQLKTPDYEAGIYDYLHLGILYYELGQFDLARETLTKQERLNDIAENRYYTALTNLALGNNESYHENLVEARVLYLEKRRLIDYYSHPQDKIYLKDIEIALGMTQNND